MKKLVYLDNAATTFPKPQGVFRAVNDALSFCGNPGRGGHSLSIYSAKKVYSCRERICSLFNFDCPENVVFTYNTTYALNMAIRGLFCGKGEILISNLEHNSTLRPIFAMQKENENIKYKTFDALSGNDDDIVKSFEGAVSEKTRMAVVTMCSNVTGRILPYGRISKICEKKNITLILDGAQCAGCVKIDLSRLYFSAVCFAGHKSLYGITGTGFCIFGKGANPRDILQGGNGVESASPYQEGPLPERLEVGTLGVVGICALDEGIRHIQRVGEECIFEKCSYFERKLCDSLCEMKNVSILGRTEKKVATLLFNVESIPSERVASLLNERGICVRAGLHCAPLAHSSLGTLSTGAVRTSISHFNTSSDIDYFVDSLFKIQKT